MRWAEQKEQNLKSCDLFHRNSVDFYIGKLSTNLRCGVSPALKILFQAFDTLPNLLVTFGNQENPHLYVCFEMHYQYYLHIGSIRIWPVIGVKSEPFLGGTRFLWTLE